MRLAMVRSEQPSRRAICQEGTPIDQPMMRFSASSPSLRRSQAIQYMTISMRDTSWLVGRKPRVRGEE